MANVFRAAAAALLPCLLMATTLSAAGLPNARLLVLSPPGGQQGTDLEVGIEGDDLDEATHLIFSHPGITATAKSKLMTVCTESTSGVANPANSSEAVS